MAGRGNGLEYPKRHPPATTRTAHVVPCKDHSSPMDHGPKCTGRPSFCLVMSGLHNARQATVRQHVETGFRWFVFCVDMVVYTCISTNLHVLRINTHMLFSFIRPDHRGFRKVPTLAVSSNLDRSRGLLDDVQYHRPDLGGPVEILESQISTHACISSEYKSCMKIAHCVLVYVQYIIALIIA